MPQFKNISIIGLGLIGGAIAKAARKKNAADVICAFNRGTYALEKAKEIGVIDVACDNLKDAVKDADLIILCTPIGTYGQIAAEIAPHMKSGAILSDVGSVKGCTIEHIVPHLSVAQMENFVPAHPIAGSEKSGIDAASADLYEGRQLIITPHEKSSEQAIEKLEKFWQALGSHVEVVEADIHDEIYATTSHIPHLIAFCYANMLCQKEVDLQEFRKNTEFKKFIRLAGSSVDMWTDIFCLNKAPILENIGKYFAVDAMENNLALRILESKKLRVEIGSAEQGDFDGRDAYGCVLPAITASLLIECAMSFDHVGAGFLGMTEVILAVAEDFVPSHEAINAYAGLHMQIEKICNLIKADNIAGIKEYIASSGAVYKKILS